MKVHCKYETIPLIRYAVCIQFYSFLYYFSSSPHHQKAFLLEIDQFVERFCIISKDNKLSSSTSEVHTTKKLQSSDKNHAAGISIQRICLFYLVCQDHHTERQDKLSRENLQNFD
jgi:hypothetical protein